MVPAPRTATFLIALAFIRPDSGIDVLPPLEIMVEIRLHAINLSIFVMHLLLRPNGSHHPWRWMDG